MQATSPQSLLQEANKMTEAIHVTPLYAVLCAIILIVLSFRTLLIRRSAGIGIGANKGGSEDRNLARAIRAHGNFVEYTPIALILMAMLELRTGSSTALWILGAILVIARIVHALGISREPENLKLRVAGMVLTFTALIGLSSRLLFTYL